MRTADRLSRPWPLRAGAMRWVCSVAGMVLVIGLSEAQAPVLVKDIRAGSSSSFPTDLTNVNGMLFFAARGSVISDSELWKSDGTEVGTARVKDILPGSSGSNPDQLTNANGTLFFSADDGTNGNELWKSDGTEVGTVLVRDIRAGFPGSKVESLTNVNGTLFFSADDGINGIELWKSDGTEVGTVLVKNIFPGTSSSFLRFLTDVNGTLFFAVDDGTNGLELWKSDGTAGGTVLVKDVFPGTSTSNLHHLTNVNGTLFLAADDGTNGIELWKSDGTAGGTVLVKDIFPGASGSNPFHLTNVNGTLFFTASDSANGGELWKSDGTSGGTVLVKDIFPGTSGSSPVHLTNVNGTLFFVAIDGTSGSELWTSDGTPGGTVLVKDILPGGSGSYPDLLTNVNGTLFFTADDGTNGVELWTSDWTAGGTVRVADIAAGPAGSNPLSLTMVCPYLFFSADDGLVGRELWSLPCPPSDSTWNSQWHSVTGIYPDASCPWALFDTASPEAPVLSGGFLALATSEAAENLYYLQNTDMSIPNTLRIVMQLRVVAETHIEGNPRRGVGIGFAVAPDLGNVLFFGHDEVFLWAGAYGQQGPTASVDTDNALHIYEIRVVNQSAITVYQDGVQILTGSTLASPSWDDAPTFYWGDITSSSFATSEWVFFRHNANTLPCGTAPALGVPPGSRRDGSPTPAVSLMGYPNPARGPITFALRATVDQSGPAWVRIHDVTGRVVKSLAVGPLPQGLTRLTWDGTDERERAVSSGTYLLLLEVAGRRHGSIKATILR